MDINTALRINSLCILAWLISCATMFFSLVDIIIQSSRCHILHPTCCVNTQLVHACGLPTHHAHVGDRCRNTDE